MVCISTLAFRGPSVRRASRCRYVLHCAVLLAVGGTLMTVQAHAEDSAFCQQMRARAASDATLLMAPRLVLQELRFPQNNQLDLGATTGRGYQFRAGVSYSLIDLWKGFATLDAGDAACFEHEAKMALQDRLEYGHDSARLAALAAESTYLAQRRTEWTEIASRAAQRLARRVITILDFTKLLQVTNALDLKFAKVHGDETQLRERLPQIAEGSLEELVDDYALRSKRLEREISSVRELEAWQLRLSAGVIAQAPIDWYGLAELSFSFGGFFRPGFEHDYQRAKAAERLSSPDEPTARYRKLHAETQLEVRQGRHELEASRRSLGALLAALNLLENMDAENVQHARDALTVESISAEAEVVYLEKWLDVLASSR